MNDEFQRVPSILLEMKRIVDQKALDGRDNTGMYCNMFIAERQSSANLPDNSIYSVSFALAIVSSSFKISSFV